MYMLYILEKLEMLVFKMPYVILGCGLSIGWTEPRLVGLAFMTFIAIMAMGLNIIIYDIQVMERASNETD